MGIMYNVCGFLSGVSKSRPPPRTKAVSSQTSTSLGEKPCLIPRQRLQRWSQSTLWWWRLGVFGWRSGSVCQSSHLKINVTIVRVFRKCWSHFLSAWVHSIHKRQNPLFLLKSMFDAPTVVTLPGPVKPAILPYTVIVLGGLRGGDGLDIQLTKQS